MGTYYLGGNLPEKFERLKQRFEGDPNNTVIHAACWDSDGDNLPLFRANNNGASSSLLSPQLHLVVHPHVSFVEEEGIRTSRLDSILAKDVALTLSTLTFKAPNCGLCAA